MRSPVPTLLASLLVTSTSCASAFVVAAPSRCVVTVSKFGGEPLTQRQQSNRSDGKRYGRSWRESNPFVMQGGGRNIFDFIRDEDVATLRKYVDGAGPVHVADALGETSLFLAASTGNVEMMKVLTSAADADVNYPCFHGGETPLMMACMQGHLGLVEFLVMEAGADINAVNHRGDTALSLAAFWGKVDCVKFLLSRPEVNTEIQNIQGHRAGEGMQELMRDDSMDEQTISLLRDSRRSQGLTRS